MSNVLTERFEMRLSEACLNRLKFIEDQIDADSRAVTMRYLIDRRYIELIGGEINAGK